MAPAFMNLKGEQGRERAIKTAEIHKKLQCGTCYMEEVHSSRRVDKWAQSVGSREASWRKGLLNKDVSNE